MPPFIAKILASPKALIGVGAAVVVFLLVVSLFASFNGKQKEMVRRETALSAQYSDNQAELSKYISTVKEALGVADRNTAGLDQVLADAIKGRYDGDTTANPTGGALFSAIVEAYPDLSGVSLPYAKVQDAVIAGRSAYKNQQTKLLDMLRDYETWKESGFISSAMIGMIGAPSDNLRAAIGTDVVRGQEALDRMYVIVLAPEAKDATQSGEMDPLDLGPEE